MKIIFECSGFLFAQIRNNTAALGKTKLIPENLSKKYLWIPSNSFEYEEGTQINKHKTRK